jgi:hypothetical protein
MSKFVVDETKKHGQQFDQITCCTAGTRASIVFAFFLY